MMEVEGSQCSICHDDVLCREACALRCGHVYHLDCVHKWLAVGKGECPQCKKITLYNQVRVLAFETIEFRPEEAEMLQTLRDMPKDERSRLQTATETEQIELTQSVKDCTNEIESGIEKSKEHAARRKEFDARNRELEAEKKQLFEERTPIMEKCAQLETQVETDFGRQREKLPVLAAREEDADVKQEQRTLKSMKLSLRTKQLHEALISALRNEAECSSHVQSSSASLRQTEEELTRLRELEAELRHDLGQTSRSTSQDFEASQRGMATSPSVSTSAAAALAIGGVQDSGRRTLRRQGSELGGLSTRSMSADIAEQRTSLRGDDSPEASASNAPSESSAPPAKVARRAVEEDELLLYSKPRSGGSGGTLFGKVQRPGAASGAGSGAGGRFGALFAAKKGVGGASAGTPGAAVNCATPQKSANGLFAQAAVPRVGGQSMRTRFSERIG